MQKVHKITSCVIYTLIYLYCWFPIRTEIVDNLRFVGQNKESVKCNETADALTAVSITSSLLSGTIKAIIIAFVIQIAIFFSKILSLTTLPIDLKKFSLTERDTVFKSYFSEVYNSSGCDDIKSRMGEKKKLSLESLAASFDDMVMNAYCEAQDMDDVDNAKDPTNSSSDFFDSPSIFYTAVAYNIQFALFALLACGTLTYIYEKAILPFIDCDQDMLIVQANIICMVNLCVYLGMLFYVFLFEPSTNA